MLKYTKEEAKVIEDYNKLLTESQVLNKYMLTEDFKNLDAEKRTDKVMQLHYMKQDLAVMLHQIRSFVPVEVEDKPAKPMGLGDGIETNPENLN